jgi:hypothetical protein
MTVRVLVTHLLDTGYRLDLCQESYPDAPPVAWRRRAYAVENLYGWAVLTEFNNRTRQELVADKAAARRALERMVGGAS